MKVYLNIIFVFVTCVSLAQNDALNQKDSLERKHGKWVVYGKENPNKDTTTRTPFTGYKINYRYFADSIGKIDSVKYEEGAYVDDRKEGLWIKYHDDGKTPKLTGYYENNRPKGPYVKTWDNGQIREKGTFTKNLQLDSIITYYSNGNKWYESWHNEYGKEEGVVNYYHENGQLEFTFKAKNGIPVDTAYRYYNNGDRKELIVYDNDGRVIKTQQFDAIHPLEPIITRKESDEPTPDLAKMPGSYTSDKLPTGYHKIYNENGEIWLDGVFKNGVLMNGKQYIYDSDGILLKVKVYKEGVHHSGKK